MLVDKLAVLAATQPAHRMRGAHACRFCVARPGRPDDAIFTSEEVAGHRLELGSAEVWVPSPDRQRVYAAPDLIVHYIARHRYVPPRVFLDALDAQRPDSWNGAAECERRIDLVFREHARAQGLDVE